MCVDPSPYSAEGLSPPSPALTCVVPAVQVSSDVDLNESFILMLNYPHHWKCPPLPLESFLLL